MTADADRLVAHEPCPKCGSRDNLARYADGHAHCFGCRHHEPPTGASPTRPKRGTSVPTAKLIEGSVRDLRARRLSAETCALFDYSCGEYRGRPVQIAGYHRADGGPVVAQKVRFPDKDFTVLGDFKAAGLFGQHLWRDSGKMVVITEGEIDCLTVSQLQNNKWPVVSVPNGAQGAKKALAAQLQWLLNFDTVVLMFDDDDPGRAAVAECGPLFPVGRCKVARIPGFKDANEALVAGKGAAVIDAIWGAKEYRPDGLVTLDDVAEDVSRAPLPGLPWAWPSLTRLTYGRRWGEVYSLGAGTGVGKTDVLTQQAAYDLVELGLGVGLFFLEQTPVETVRRVAGKLMGRRFHVPDGDWTPAELDDGIRQLQAGGKLYVYNSAGGAFGSTGWETIQGLMRYLAHHEGVKVFYIDHLTALAAEADDERRALESMMAEIAGLAQELGAIVLLVSHLATPEGKPHEEGGRVMIRHFKGSRAIGYWSYFMFGLERNQQDENEETRHTTALRVLKDRYTGQATGQVVHLRYDHEHGLLHETDAVGGGPFQDETGGAAKDQF